MISTHSQATLLHLSIPRFLICKQSKNKFQGMIRNNVTHTGHGPSLSMEGHCEEEEEDFKDNSKLLNLALTYTTLLVFL